MIDQQDKSEMAKFARFVKEKREAMGMSCDQLSFKAFGKNRRSYISEIELGVRKGITISAMEKILAALNTEIKYIEN